jgi:hypothetical protein
MWDQKSRMVPNCTSTSATVPHDLLQILQQIFQPAQNIKTQTNYNPTLNASYLFTSGREEERASVNELNAKMEGYRKGKAKMDEGNRRGCGPFITQPRGYQRKEINI